MLTDNFNRSDENLEASSDWAKQDSGDFPGTLAISSNTLGVGDTTSALYRWVSNDMEGDHYALADVLAVNSGGPAVRLPSLGNAGGYACHFSTGFGAAAILRLESDGSVTTLSEGGMGDLGSGIDIKLTATSSALTLHRGATLLLSTSDGTWDDSNVGVGVFCLENRTPFLDNWEADPEASALPEITVSGNGQDISNGDSSPSETDHTDFGSAAVTGGTVDRIFTIGNIGSGDLTLSGDPKVAVTGDFSVHSAPSSPVSSSGTTAFTLRFNPTTGGLRTGTVSIANDDADENPFTFSIQGTGVDREIDIRGNDVSITDGASPLEENFTDFGTVPYGDSLSATFYIHNLGTTDLNLSGDPKVELTGDSEFTVTLQPSSPVTGGSSTSFEIQFTPSSLQDFTAVVSIDNDDDNENPFTFQIQGSGSLGGYTMSDSDRAAMWLSQESTYGTAPTGSGSAYTGLRFTNESLILNNETRESNEISGDRQVSNQRITAKSVTGQINTEMSYGSHEELLESLLASSFGSTVVVASADTAVSVTASSKTFTHGTGWDNTPDPGDWVVVAGAGEAANNGLFKVVSATSTTMVVEGATLADESATEAFTITVQAAMTNASTEAPFSVAKQFLDLTNIINVYSGLVVDSATFTLPASELITASYTVNGQKMVTATSLPGETNTAANTNQSMTAAEDVIGILQNGVAFLVTNFTLNVSNNTRNRRVVGSVLDVSKGLGTFNCSGSFTVYFADQTFTTQHINFSSLGLAFILQDPDGNRYVFDMPEAKLTKADSPVTGRSSDVMQSMEFNCTKDVSEGVTLRIVKIPA